ncbi:MAG: hypothetical protein J1F35_08335 [Erysipelotrichales bacterium]|nr:hypothetical protein [Erysipelotrichales bacterium]
MKSLVNYISEAQTNSGAKSLFSEIDKKLVRQQWDEIAPIIEKIFKNKWGKTIKLDDNFRDIIKRGQQLLLGYNIKDNSWIIVRYNARVHGVRGVVYNGEEAIEIGKTPMYWSNIENSLKDKKFKLRFGDAYSDEVSAVVNSFDMLHYNFED